ncbi:MAG: T9SS type A sorting domain-containing protein [Bacteroidales bacterium]|nr:T9SS type A sorting domain-containing protein [Bacteroidales bacterium]
MKNFIRFICLFICCLATAGYTQNAPRSIAGTAVCLESAATLPVYAEDFDNISSCNLKLSYDPSIATATSVTIGPGMGGMISTNLTNPGIIVLGWFTSGGINLPDSSVIFNIQFEKVNNGISNINWIDDGFSCEYNDGNFEPLNDEPANQYYLDGSLAFQSPEAPVTMLPDIALAPGTNVEIPVIVADFQMIGSLSLSLQFDPSVMTWLSFSNYSGFPGMMVDGSQQGSLQISGLVPEDGMPHSLNNNDTLLVLNFLYLDGFSALSWIDDGQSSQFGGANPVYPVLNDIPQSAHYINGSVSANALPASAGAISGPPVVCSGTSGITYSVPVIAYATDYQWEVPEGMTIVSGQHTNTLLVDSGPDIYTGIITVYGINGFGSGEPASMEISSIGLPGAAGVITGQQEVCQGQEEVLFTVQPVPGTTSYNWMLPEGASIVAGAGTNAVTVTFSISATSGSIAVFGSNMCGSGPVSSPLPVIVKEIPLILNQPVSPPAICAGSGNTMFFVHASGTGISYQWQEYSSSWNDLDENGMYSGVHADTLVIIDPEITMNGFRYRCTVSGECEPDAVSDGNAILTVLLPVGTSASNDQLKFFVYPNPFNDQINLSLYIPCKGELQITVQNLLGETIELIHEYNTNPGEYQARIKTACLAPGMYLLNMKLNNEINQMISTTKIVCTHLSQ